MQQYRPTLLPDHSGLRCRVLRGHLPIRKGRAEHNRIYIAGALETHTGVWE